MSIATQTPAERYNTPVDKATARESSLDYDGVSDVDHTADMSVDNVIAFPERRVAPTERGDEAHLERVGPEYSFENLGMIREMAAELEEQLGDLQGELLRYREAAQSSYEQMDDIGMFKDTSIAPARAEGSIGEAADSRTAALADAALVAQLIEAKKTYIAKLHSWQTEVERALEQVGDPQYCALKDAETVHPYSAGVLNRADGTIADRTPWR